ncbi:sphingomyelin phosphodiesterase isoform X6 [Dermacentor silvarum]|uniref:sphingomyelin phosphodiesterase isoform X3 n=1 Tax=Dermacentor silvarum TaxID=543639 RepID=UPI002101958F|nr:sphingomyelin phosphodiesterase isoform X3 [Dermacentor silvarum]XP_049527024.1 sphingomyelin phosphodiesterase isoform X4 [Dermacentor silvarum]XP_049527025.1 sphingomyelin phosphodiesterase isoform X5 [Dermacentor silvarum]XP_049527026.1 sphingomyelin phosphodiesterase isoform X6 [Dermacentor silvarum]
MMMPLVLLLVVAVGMTVSRPIRDKEMSSSPHFHWTEPLQHRTQLQIFAKSMSHLFSGKRILSCSICSSLVKGVLTDIRRGLSGEVVIHDLRRTCKLFRLAGSRRVCDGLASTFKDQFIYAMRKTRLSAEQVCGSVLGEDCGGQATFKWTIALPGTEKPVPVPPSPKPGAPTLRFLHITDVHVDLRYSVGSRADCLEPLCCREENGKANRLGNNAAGYWGSLRKCDLPARTLENMLKTVRDNLKVDYVIWTGDIVPHDYWNTSREGNIAVTKYTADAIAKFLPGVPVFPAIGNHESHPSDSFPPPEEKGEMSVAWLYGALADQWSRWLPPSATNTLRRAGYYSARLRPGLKIISLNTNYCDSLNVWLLINATDQAQQLSWLVNELHESETMGEKVHIIAHIAPGVWECLHVWSDNYHRILERYEDTVRGQFFGHTHADEVEVAYDSKDPKRALGVAYLGPSLTTYGSGHPAFRVFTVDAGYPEASWTILDHHTYLLNLTAANARPDVPPRWELEYSARAAYNLSSLEPQQWDALLLRMERDDDLFYRFFRFYYKGMPRTKRCNGWCRRRFLCKQKTASSSYLKWC